MDSPATAGAAILAPANQTTITNGNALLDAVGVAALMNVSLSWVRRHTSDLPSVRVGRLVRFDSALISQQMRERIRDGKSLKPGRKPMAPCRYQRGYVYKRGTKLKVWYGMYREDVRNPDGHIERRQRKVRLGTVAELPTKNAAVNKLSDILGSSSSNVSMSFRELAERWERAEGSTMKKTTLAHYQNALHAYVLPHFGSRKIAGITREDVQTFLAVQSTNYSRSSLRSMKVVLGLTLGWANDCGWLERNPCTRVKLPRTVGGKTITRTVVTPEQVNALAGKLEEPFATLVLFLYATGLRIGEAAALKWTDFTGNVLHVTRRICDGDMDKVKSKSSERSLPIDPALLERMGQLGKAEWVFRSRTGTPINPGNALKRYVRPAAEALGLALGGWHDFRHTLTTTMRRAGVHPKVLSGILGHSKVNLAMDTYDRVTVEDFQQPLADLASQLLPSVTKSEATA